MGWSSKPGYAIRQWSDHICSHILHHLAMKPAYTTQLITYGNQQKHTKGLPDPQEFTTAPQSHPMDNEYT